LRSSGPFLIPAILYFGQSMLAFIALSSLTPIQFGILSQLRIPIDSVCGGLLHSKLNWSKWRSNVLFLIGIWMTVWGNDCSLDRFVFFPAMCSALSSLCGCLSILWSQWFLQSNQCFWDSTFQLAFWGVCCGLTPALLLRKEFSWDYSWVTWIVILTGAFGGLSSPEANAWNLQKGCVTVFGLVIAFFIDSIFTEVKRNVIIGVLVVILALVNFSDEGKF